MGRLGKEEVGELKRGKRNNKRLKERGGGIGWSEVYGSLLIMSRYIKLMAEIEE